VGWTGSNKLTRGTSRSYSALFIVFFSQISQCKHERGNSSMTHLIESNKLEMNLMLLHCLTIFDYRYEQCERSIQHTDRLAFDIEEICRYVTIGTIEYNYVRSLIINHAFQLQQVVFNYLIKIDNSFLSFNNSKESSILFAS